MYLATYVIVLILIIGFIIHLCQLVKSIKNKKLIELMIAQPASSSIFYGLVVLIFILLFANLNNLVNAEVDKPITLEDIYQYSIIIFFTIMMIWSCIEVRICYLMFKEDNRRTVDADVSRRNEEIMNRTREQEAREREEFERNFSHLND
jgi:dolichyl-phosphate-mannose--protein O-mannosyl transferase